MKFLLLRPFVSLSLGLCVCLCVFACIEDNYVFHARPVCKFTCVFVCVCVRVCVCV